MGAGLGIDDVFTQIQPTKILQNAFFGEASYTFFDQLTATAGLRRFYYHGTVNTAVSGWLSSSTNASTDYFSTGERDTGVTPKFNLSYQFDPELLLYGNGRSGFPPGRRQSADSDHGAPRRRTRPAAWRIFRRLA